MDQTATQILHRLAEGDSDAAGHLLPLVYDELRARAAAHFRHQPLDHTLQPTALVHEAYLKMIDQTAPQWKDRAHFCAVAATAMRQILIDHARSRNADKRGGEWQRVALDSPGAAGVADRGEGGELGELDVLALDESLKTLAKIDPRQARVVELRFFAGISVEEAAEVLGVSARTVELDWKMAKAWLSRALSET